MKTRIRYLTSFITIICIFAALLIWIYSVFAQNVIAASAAVFIIWGAAVYSAFCRESRNYIYIFFLFTIFLFLLSRVMVRLVLKREVYAPFNPETMLMIYSCLFLSICGLITGVATKSLKISSNSGVLKRSRRSEIDYPLLRKLSAFATVICGFASILVVVEKIVFWNATGSGGSLRTDYVSGIPEIVLRLSYLYVMMLCIYLATLPSKKECLPILIQYLVTTSLQMFYGSRFDFAVGLMFFLTYFLIREKLDNKSGNENENGKGKWLGKKWKMMVLISIPILVVLMTFVDNYRSHSSFQFSSLFDTFSEFCEKQGTSFDVIGNTIEYQGCFKQPRGLYLFDNTYGFITTNPIARLITGSHVYAANTIERAQYGTSLGMTLYYRINPVSYLAGKGCGSSYIAECWLGYGYVGLFILNFILGRVLTKLDEYKYDRFLPTFFALIFIESLYYMPRGGFDTFVGNVFTVTNLLAAFALWVIYQVIKSRKA